MEKYDLIIVGAGPAGIFTAVELFRRGAHKKILMVEKGQSVEKRSCPKSKTQKCVNCQPCNITTGQRQRQGESLNGRAVMKPFSFKGFDHLWVQGEVGKLLFC